MTTELGAVPSAATQPDDSEFDRYAFRADMDITRSTCGGRAGRYASEVTQRAFAVWCDQQREIRRLREALLKCKTCALPTEVRELVVAALLGSGK